MHSSTKQEITLFTHVSGNEQSWERFSAYLDSIIYPHNKIRLILLDISNSSDFEIRVKNRIRKTSFLNIRYMKITEGNDGCPDSDLINERRKAICGIYNAIKRVVKTDLVWILEEDVIPPGNALNKLLGSMTPGTVSVSGVCKSRCETGYVDAWDINDKLLQQGNDIDVIRGNGFGCVLLRMDTLRKHVFMPGEIWRVHGHTFYSRLAEDEIVKLDWSVICDHQ